MISDRFCGQCGKKEKNKTFFKYSILSKATYNSISPLNGFPSAALRLSQQHKRASKPRYQRSIYSQRTSGIFYARLAFTCWVYGTTNPFEREFLSDVYRANKTVKEYPTSESLVLNLQENKYKFMFLFSLIVLFNLPMLFFFLNFCKFS